MLSYKIIEFGIKYNKQKRRAFAPLFLFKKTLLKTLLCMINFFILYSKIIIQSLNESFVILSNNDGIKTFIQFGKIELFGIYRIFYLTFKHDSIGWVEDFDI
jgi:hypothetical protein